MKKLVAIVIIMGIFGGACSKQNVKAVPLPLSETNRIIDPVKVDSQKSITQSAGALTAHDNYAITLKKSALGQTFIMRTALIESIPNPTGNHLAAKVVYFKKNGSTVGLFELTDRRYETSALPTEVLLTTFPTLSEDNESVTVDFNKGMNKLFYSRGTYTTDLSGGQDAQEDIYSISDSFVDRAVIQGETLYVDQFVRLTAIEEGKQSNFAMRIKYNFQSYVYDKNFPSKLTTGQIKVGFFEVNPLIVPGSTERQVMIAKWNIDKPITFYLSRNTPEEFRAPITDAVLYWNKVFKAAVDKEPLRVELLPENVDLYTPGYNIIQWMDNDAAGAAYADVEADPLTGEILRTNIYMPSVFSTSGESDGYDTLFEIVANSKKATTSKTLLLKSFQSARYTESYDIASLLKNMNTEIGAMAADSEKDGEKIDLEAIVKRFRDDTVRETVAHEVGHCLGLRHNFAGSTYTNINKNNFESLSKTYFLTGKLGETQKTVSTLMDYEVPMLAAMTGGVIRLGLPPLAYDVAAMKWGYSDASAASMSFGPFCTDSHLMTNVYSDCKQFDQFTNPTEGNFYSYNERIKKLAFIYANTFGQIINNDQITDKVPYLKKVTLNPLNISRYLVNGLSSTLDTLSPVSQSVNLLQKFGSVSYFNQKDYLEATNNYKRQSVNALGGLTNMVFADYTPTLSATGFTIPVVEKMRVIFDKNIENLYGDNLKAEERAAIAEAANRYFKAITLEILTNHAVLLNKISFFEVEENFPAALTTYVDTVLFSKGSEELVRNQDGTKIIMKPMIDNVRSDADLRGLTVLTTVHNFFPSEASYEYDIGQMSSNLWTKFTAERNEITSTAQTPNRKTLNWLRTEDKRFAPIAPN